MSCSDLAASFPGHTGLSPLTNLWTFPRGRARTRAAHSCATKTLVRVAGTARTVGTAGTAGTAGAGRGGSTCCSGGCLTARRHMPPSPPACSLRPPPGLPLTPRLLPCLQATASAIPPGLTGISWPLPMPRQASDEVSAPAATSPQCSCPFLQGDACMRAAPCDDLFWWVTC